MKKRLTFITLLMLFCTTMFGQNHWEFDNENNYILSMSIMCSVTVNGTEVDNIEDVEIAAFHNNTLRSAGNKFTYTNSDGEKFAFFKIYGASEGEEITFKLYLGKDDNGNDIILNSVYDELNIVNFTDGDILGNPTNLVNIDFDYTHYDVVTNFAFSMSVMGEIYIDNVLQNRTDIEVAAFSMNNGVEQLRGASRTIQFPIDGTTYCYVPLSIGSDNASGDVIYFKLYDFNADKEYNSSNGPVIFTKESILGSYPDFYQLYFYTPEAIIGETEYQTLAAAVEAAEEGATITVLKDLAEGCEINKEVTIDFASFGLAEGKVISITEGGVATFENDANVTGVELYGGQLFTETALNIVAKKDFASVSANANTNVGWGTIATPIDGAEVPTFEGVQHDMYTYSENAMSWKYVGASIETFTLGMGYLYANSSEQDNLTIELEGTLNIADKSVELSYTENALAGFNMIGNPFSFNITEANFSGATLSNGFYVISAEGAIVARPENATIAPMESVMVQTNAAETLTISKTAATKRNAADNGMIAINVSNENYSDVAYVSFNEGLGLNKINHRNAEIPMVYIPVEGENFAIATMSQDVTTVPVSFRAMTMGEYTISAEAQNCEYSSMTLVDRQTGIETNLLIEDYTFIAKTNDNADRFFIRLNNSQQTTDNGHFAYINNGMINIDNVEGQGMLNIYDVTGRSVAEYNVFESACISTSDFTSGMYIIRMSDENGIKVQKIIIE